MISQAAPSAGQLVDCFTAVASCVVRMVICNRGASTEYRVALAPLGAADEAKHYLVYDEPLQLGETLVTEPLKLDATDVLRVRSSSGSVSFTVNGLED